MPAFNCRLNSTFLKLRKNTKVVIDWNTWSNELLVVDNDKVILRSPCPVSTNLSCCGISEITFGEDFVNNLATLSKTRQAIVLAKVLFDLVCGGDHRIFIVGLVTSSADYYSNEQSYKTLQKLLTRFGAKPLNSPAYVNSNSNNSIVVMAMRKPERVKKNALY